MTEKPMPAIPVVSKSPPSAHPRLVKFLIGAALVSGWLCWPTAWIWLHNSEPQVLTLEEFIAHGSTREWVTLKECYVPTHGRVNTVAMKGQQQVGSSYTYYALHTSATDQRPAKVFVRPVSWSEGNEQTWLGRPGEASGDVSHRAMDGKDAELQEVSGVLAIGWQYGGDVKKILRGKGAEDAALLLHNDRPAGAGEGVAAMLTPPLLAAMALVLYRRGSRVA